MSEARHASEMGRGDVICFWWEDRWACGSYDTPPHFVSYPDEPGMTAVDALAKWEEDVAFVQAIVRFPANTKEGLFDE